MPLPIAVLAGTIMIAGLRQTSGAMPAPMQFSSQSGNPLLGCTLPTAMGNTRVISYTYDPLSRLTSAAYSSGECYQYSYDRVGSRTAMTTTVGTTTYQYDPANRLSSVNGQTYTWDNNGNLINDGAALYRYNQANRLISTTLNSATSLYAYNGDGVRLKQVVASAVTTYTQDLAAPLPVVLQSRAGVTTTKYLYATGTRPLAQNATAWEYLLPDGLGSVRQIASANGYISLTKDYEPYGNLLNSSGSGQSAYGFTGEERDSQTGLLFLRARYMQTRLGIFLTHDPWSGDVERPGSMNGYAYANGNPVSNVDPAGICTNCGFATLAKVNSDMGLNLRSAPSSSAPLLQTLQNGSLVFVIFGQLYSGTNGPWRAVGVPWHSRSTVGFVADQYIDKVCDLWMANCSLVNSGPTQPGPTPLSTDKWVSPFGAGVGYLKGYRWTGTSANDHNGIDLVSPNDPYAISGQVNYSTAGIWYESGIECPQYENYPNDTEGRKVVAVASGIVGVIPKGTARDSSIINLHYSDGSLTNYQVQYVHMNAAPGIANGQTVSAGDLLGWYGPYGDWGGIMHLHLGLKVGQVWSDPEPYLP